MKHEELTPEELKELPDEIQQGLKDGTALALPVPKPSLSNRWYTVLLATMVALLVTPIWVPPTTFVFACLGFQGVLWLTLYWLEGHQHALAKLHLSISEAVLDRTFDMITQAADKARNINGTKDGEDGLTTYNADKDVRH